MHSSAHGYLEGYLLKEALVLPPWHLLAGLVGGSAVGTGAGIAAGLDSTGVLATNALGTAAGGALGGYAMIRSLKNKGRKQAAQILAKKVLTDQDKRNLEVLEQLGLAEVPAEKTAGVLDRLFGKTQPSSAAPAAPAPDWRAEHGKMDRYINDFSKIRAPTRDDVKELSLLSNDFSRKHGIMSGWQPKKTPMPAAPVDAQFKRQYGDRSWYKPSQRLDPRQAPAAPAPLTMAQIRQQYGKRTMAPKPPAPPAPRGSDTADLAMNRRNQIIKYLQDYATRKKGGKKVTAEQAKHYMRAQESRKRFGSDQAGADQYGRLLKYVQNKWPANPPPSTPGGDTI